MAIWLFYIVSNEEIDLATRTGILLSSDYFVSLLVLLVVVQVSKPFLKALVSLLL